MRSIYSRLPLLALHFVLAMTSLLKAGEEPIWQPQQRADIKKYINDCYFEGGFCKLKTINYEIVTEADIEFTAKTGAYMEFVRTSLDETIGLSKSRKQKIDVLPKVFIYASQRAYQHALGTESLARGWFRYKWNNKHEFTGFSLYSYRETNGRPVSFEQFYWPILTHEGVHQILQGYAGANNIPNLLNEGYASYLQSWNFSYTAAKNMTYRKSVNILGMPDTRFGVGDFVPLSSIIDADPWRIENSKKATSARYFMAEMLIEFLLSTDENKTKLKGWLLEVIDGKSDEQSVK